MPADEFARIAARAIYNKENELSISNSHHPTYLILIRNLCADFSFYNTRLDAKKQAKALIKK